MAVVTLTGGSVERIRGGRKEGRGGERREGKRYHLMHIQ